MEAVELQKLYNFSGSKVSEIRILSFYKLADELSVVAYEGYVYFDN